MKKVTLFMSALTMALVGCGGDNIANNPLVQEWDTPYQTPPFSKIELKHYEPTSDRAAWDAAYERFCKIAEIV